MKQIVDKHLPNEKFKIVFHRSGHAQFLVAVESLGEVDTGLTGYTARLYYYKTVRDSSSFQIDSDSLDAATGTFTFNVAPADLAAAGAYRAALSIIDGSDNIFLESLGNVIIQESILEAGPTAATTGPQLDFAEFTKFLNVEANGPYRPGTNITFSVNPDGSVDINGGAGGGGAVDSVFGRTGAVVAASGDYTADEVTETASNKIMTAAERTKLSGVEANATADQTGAEIKTAYEAEADTNAFTDAEQNKLSGVEMFATADQSNTEIANLYQQVVAFASQAEMEAGTETTERRMSPLRVAQAIAALGGGGGGSMPAHIERWEGFRFPAFGGPLGTGASAGPFSESGTNQKLRGAAFDDTTEETAGPFVMYIPPELDGTTVEFHIHGFGGAASNVKMRISYARNGDNALTNEDLTFAAGTSKTAIQRNTISATISGLAGEDQLFFYLTRVAADAADVLSGDFSVTLLTAEVPRA